MSDAARMVREFHEAFGLRVCDRPETPSPRLAELRLSLLYEEVDELRHAIGCGDIVAIADALGDILYVTYGAATSFGIPLDAVVAEIHRSNMSKLGADGRPIYRADGKVLKGPHYWRPNIEGVLFPYQEASDE